MRRFLVSCGLFALLWMVAAIAMAGLPHMVTCTQTQVGNTFTLDGKEAGLGDVHYEIADFH